MTDLAEFLASISQSERERLAALAGMISAPDPLPPPLPAPQMACVAALEKKTEERVASDINYEMRRLNKLRVSIGLPPWYE